MDKLIRDRLEHVQRTLKAAYDASQELKSGHSSITGTEREIFVSNFLREMFPPQFRFGSGMIIDKQGRKTGQLDIVIELPLSPSFPLGLGTPRVYLADTIGAVIEVKSEFDNEEWERINKQLRSGTTSYRGLKEVKRNVRVFDKLGNLIVGETIPAYVVGYTGYQKLSTFKEKVEEYNNSVKNESEEANPWIRSALQVDPPLFVGSEGDTFKGAEAFGAFIASLDFELQRVVWGHANLWSYFGINTYAE